MIRSWSASDRYGCRGRLKIPLLLPSFKGITPSFPACARPTTQAFHISSPPQVAENLPRHVVAHSRTGSLQVGQGEFAWEGFDCRLDDFCLGAAGAFCDVKAALEFAISRFEDKQQVVDIRQRVMLSFVPSLGTLFKGFVVSLLVLFDQAFQADVPSHLVSQMITLQ